MNELFFQYRADAQLILGIAACLAMLRWGRGPERAIALVWILGLEAADALYHAVAGLETRFDVIDPFHAGMDASAAVIFCIIAIYANRMYPLWIAALQLLSAIAHLVRDLVESITPIAYAVMSFAPSWGILTCMIMGMIAHLKRARKFGEYRDWLGKPPLMLDRLTPGQASRPGAVS